MPEMTELEKYYNKFSEEKRLGQRRGIANAQRRPVLALATTREQAGILLALNLRHAALGQTRVQVFAQKVTVRIEILRAGVGLKGALQLL